MKNCDLCVHCQADDYDAPTTMCSSGICENQSEWVKREKKDHPCRGCRFMKRDTHYTCPCDILIAYVLEYSDKEPVETKDFVIDYTKPGNNIPVVYVRKGTECVAVLPQVDHPSKWRFIEYYGVLWAMHPEHEPVKVVLHD